MNGWFCHYPAPIDIEGHKDEMIDRFRQALQDAMAK